MSERIDYAGLAREMETNRHRYLLPRTDEIIAALRHAATVEEAAEALALYCDGAFGPHTRRGIGRRLLADLRAALAADGKET